MRFFAALRMTERGRAQNDRERARSEGLGKEKRPACKGRSPVIVLQAEDYCCAAASTSFTISSEALM